MAKNEKTIRSLSGFLKAISELNSFHARDMIFRGQSDAKWELQSTAYRRLEKYDGNWWQYSDDQVASKLLEYSEALMERARRYGGREFPESIPDLRLLAKLRHHNAATILIDFTKSATTALWFACQKNKDEDGKVFCLDINSFALEPLKITHENEGEDLSELLEQLEGELIEGEFTYRAPDKIATWEPSLDNRVLKQDSFFIFNREGKLDDRNLKEIIVKRDSKGKILKQLEQSHNLSEITILPDFYGFAQNNDFEKPYGPQTAEEVFEVAEKYHRRNDTDKDDYRKVEKLYSKVIELDKGFIPAYLGRGDVKNDLDRCDEAIADFEEALKLIDAMDLSAFGSYESHLHYKSSAYQGLGLAKSKLGLNQDADYYFGAMDAIDNVLWNRDDYPDSEQDASEYIDEDDTTV